MEKEKENLWGKVVRLIFHRDSKTGKFVSKEFADENPETTQKETRKVWKKNPEPEE